MQAKDFMGNPIQEGDEVIFMFVKYRDLTKGRILKVNEKKVTIEYNLRDPRHFGRDHRLRQTTQQFHNQVIVTSFINKMEER